MSCQSFKKPSRWKPKGGKVPVWKSEHALRVSSLRLRRCVRAAGERPLRTKAAAHNSTGRVTGTHSFSPMIWLFGVETVAWISSGGVWNGSFFCPSLSKWNVARIIGDRIQPRGAGGEPLLCSGGEHSASTSCIVFSLIFHIPLILAMHRERI